jgi:hypothetical protein
MIEVGAAAAGFVGGPLVCAVAPFTMVTIKAVNYTKRMLAGELPAHLVPAYYILTQSACLWTCTPCR